MRRFKLQSGHIIKIDDADAYLMRSYVWNGVTRTPNWVDVRRSARSGFGSSVHSHVMLSHELMPPGAGEYVAHRNGDALDFRRANLEVRPRSEMTRGMRAAKRLQWLVDHA